MQARSSKICSGWIDVRVCVGMGWGWGVYKQIEEDLCREEIMVSPHNVISLVVR